MKLRKKSDIIEAEGETKVDGEEDSKNVVGPFSKILPITNYGAFMYHMKEIMKTIK